MMKFKKLLLVLAVLAFAKAYSQQTANQKIEQESRISMEQMDAAARQLILELGAKLSRTKLYQERDGLKTSYEAKFKVNRKIYSAEFDRNWQLEDIEIRSSRRILDKELWRSISSQLDGMARKWRLEKLQLQYVLATDGQPNLTERIANRRFDNIECIVAFKDDGAVYRRELLFSKKGELLSQRDIKKRKYDFLLF